MKNIGKKTIIGKHGLLLVARGETEIASQLFVYDDVREIRVDLKKLEVKLLMNFDESYYRVFAIKLPVDSSAEQKEHAKNTILKFYNDLVNASLKLTQEELMYMRKQKENLNRAQAQQTQNKQNMNQSTEEKSISFGDISSAKTSKSTVKKTKKPN